jgi:hypothetical protein
MNETEFFLVLQFLTDPLAEENKTCTLAKSAGDIAPGISARAVE